MPFPFAAGDLLPASDLNAMFPDGVTDFVSYTPVLTATTTNPTLGTGSVQFGRYYRLGTLVVVKIRITFGTSGVAAGSGDYRVSLPFATTADTVTHVLEIGTGRIVDTSAGVSRTGIHAWAATTTTASMIIDQGSVVTGTAPWTWAASDWILLSLVYEVA